MNFMLAALQEAKKGKGRVSPNPMVGAVLVKNNKIISHTYHHQAGEPHAEVLAIKKAGKKVIGSILYTNLEPCCHYGKTPPCVKAIIKAGIKTVHIAMLDPNPKVAGKGKKELEKAGIKVVVGEEKQEALLLNEIFVKYITSHKPFVAAKWAMSLDGKTATRAGESKWISGVESRLLAHKLRRQYDAILVGVNTVLKDDPRLTARLHDVHPRQTVRIVVDSAGKTPVSAKIFKARGKVIIAATKKLSKNKKQKYQERGAEVITTKSNNDKVNLKELMKELGKREITSVLIEGGGEITASFLEQNLLDKIYAFIGNKLIGGRDAKTPLGGKGIASMTKARTLHIQEIKQLGSDLLEVAYPI